MPSVSQTVSLDSHADSLGLTLRLKWGEHRLAEHFLPPQKEARFTVGSDAGVDFAMGTRLLGQKAFDVVSRDETGFSLHFTENMKGQLRRANQAVSLATLVARGEAVSEDNHYTFSLSPKDVVTVDLGDVLLEVEHQRAPKRVPALLFSKVDYAALNVFLVVFLLASAFVIHALVMDSEKGPLEDNFEKTRRVTTYVTKQPQPKLSQPLLPKGLKSNQPPGQSKPHVAPKPPKGRPSDLGQALAGLFGSKSDGVRTLLRPNGSPGYKEALGNIIGPAGATGSPYGLVPRGSPSNGSATRQTIGIGNMGTKSGRFLNYEDGIRRGASQAPPTTVEPQPMTCLRCDKELIGEVIHRNRGQIRYCYENQLTRQPNLAGKVAIKFVIAWDGSVTDSSVAQSTVNNSELENCVASRLKTFAFPKGKEGEAPIIVTYPFLFKQAGE